MLSYTQAIILGLLQGLTELFPISSLGHSVLVPALLNWNVDEHAPFFIVFLVATHLATALVLIAFYFKDWLRIAGGLLRTVFARPVDKRDTYARLAWLLIVATVPAGLLGLLFQNKLQGLFASPHIVAVFLIGNGVLLYGVERARRRRSARARSDAKSMDTAIASLSLGQALGTGLMESLALLPGFSRTGAALGGGLLAGLDHESAARFSFLLATPIILAAAVLKLPAVLSWGSAALLPLLLGMVTSGIAAAFSLVFLTRYFKHRTLLPFAIYCVAAGTLSLLAFVVHP